MKLARRVNRELLRAMDEEGVTQADLHRRLKVSRVTVCRMLNPSNDITLSSMEKLAAKLGREVIIKLVPKQAK